MAKTQTHRGARRKGVKPHNAIPPSCAAEFNLTCTLVTVRDPRGDFEEMGMGDIELLAQSCERAQENKRIYNISEARYCREVCKFNKDGSCLREN